MVRLLEPGPGCELCGLADRRLLRLARLGDSVSWLCRNHAWLAEHGEPRPSCLEDVRALVAPPGDRRTARERREAERREAERREARGERRGGPRQPDKGDRRIRERRGSRLAGPARA